MAQLILFSGPCNSGKTTLLNALSNKLFDCGTQSIILTELIRQKTDKPIDELRKNAHEYLALQEQIILEKIKQEETALLDTHIPVWIADRAITDSLFYLENYVNKTELSEEDTIRFAKLHERVCQHAENSFYRYKLVQLRPIKAIELDMFRPNNLKYLQRYEYECINRLNKYYFARTDNKCFLEINLNKTSQEDALNEIFKFANL